MMCYKDMTFCVSPNCENKCGRKLTEKIKQDAVKWWGGKDVPIAVSCFCGGTLEEVLPNETNQE